MAFKSGDDLTTLRAWKRAKSSADHEDHGTQIAVGLGWLDHEDDLPDQNLDPRNDREVAYSSNEEPVTLADLVAADVILEAQRIVTVRECLNCRKEFHPQGKGNYCNYCDRQWREQHLPVLVEIARQEEARQQAEIARLATLCVTCKMNKKNGEHPYCLPCYLATIPDCEAGCGNKANRGYPKCSPCYQQQQQAKEAVHLDLEARRYHNLGLKGSNGLPAELDFIRANIGYFRHEARIHLNRNLNAKTGASQERAKKDAERRARQLARSINPNRSK